jgi:hypothetical protein
MAARLASGSDDGVVRISEVTSGGDIFTNLSLAGEVGRVTFSPDSTRVIGMTKAGQARVWNALTGEALTPVLQAKDFNQNAIAEVVRFLNPTASFSPDGKLLLLAWGSKSAQVRDGETGALLRELTHDGVVYHAAFSPDGQWVGDFGKGRDGARLGNGHRQIGGSAVEAYGLGGLVRVQLGWYQSDDRARTARRSALGLARRPPPRA